MKLALDEHAGLDSPLHRWAAPYKIVGLGLLMLAFASIRDLRLLLPMLSIAGLVYIASRLPARVLLTRLRYPGLFLVSVIVALPLLSGETVLWQWGWLTLRQEGVQAMGLIVGRFLSILTLSVVLLGTTPFVTLVRAFRSLGLPAILADMLLLTYRYLFDLADTLAQMQQAMRLRGFGRRQRPARVKFSLWRTLNRLAALAGTLLVRSYEQSERVYKAMQLRGYGARLGKGRSDRPQGTAFDWWGVVIALISALSLVIAEALLNWQR
ncbi:MAG: cobalt ECF transporter T component CbiQ [Kaiparowitsia implicata GSE-PSE-MK54-09C]|jgi:cobalt/nickel transport system permease protein|nr:cobalt ECF transporter T component CbiQ [Kaiparowitsia implicata GSE-PSE-MK54-09C]